MTKPLPIFTLSLLFLAVGCGTAGTGGGRINANLIERQAIDELGPSNAYNVVEALRPTWLQKRGPTSFFNEGGIRVYLDDTSLGGLDELRGIHSDDIESIRRLDERQASLRYGPGHEQGVILVTTRR